MQQVLLIEKDLKSKIPEPIGTGIDKSTRRHYAAFKVPVGYYTYLSDILDEEQFITAASCCAHDLGYLLKKGYVFQNLISVFHAEDRPYTLFPSLSKVGAGNFNGFPGKIEKIIGHELYENLGASGLRDLGDIEFIDDFKFCDSRKNQVDTTKSLKIAHFISLYLLVFTIILGARSRKIEEIDKNFKSWSGNADRYSKILEALLEGIGVELSPEEWSYIDCSIQKSPMSSSGASRRMQPGEKFNEQLRIWFTTQDCVNDKVVPDDEDQDLRKKLETELQNTVYSKKIVYGKYLRIPERMIVHCAYQHRKELWQDFPGCLGQYSGINPLVTAIKYIFRATQIVITRDYFISCDRTGVEVEKVDENFQDDSVNTTMAVSTKVTINTNAVQDPLRVANNTNEDSPFSFSKLISSFSSFFSSIGNHSSGCDFELDDLSSRPSGKNPGGMNS